MAALLASGTGRRLVDSDREVLLGNDLGSTAILPATSLLSVLLTVFRETTLVMVGVPHNCIYRYLTVSQLSGPDHHVTLLGWRLKQGFFV
jgi:hypothetical protein